jgi:hypothetical protein
MKLSKTLISATIIGASILLVGQAQAVGKKNVPKYVGDTCVVDAQDPFEPHMRIDSGEYKGLCVNPTLRRSAQRLSQEEAQKYFPGTQDVVVANFSHDEQFWIAEIPFKKIDRIVLQVEYFPVALGLNVAHTQFRIVFADGAKIRLKPQSSQQKNQSKQTLEGMIFSVENISPFGEAFDPIKGLFDQYRTAYRFVSLEQKYDWMILTNGDLVEQYEFNFKPIEARLILAEGLNRGTKNSIGLSYNTVKHSCVTELYAIVDKIFGVKAGSQPFYPNSAPKEFFKRGYLQSLQPIISFNDEFKL